MQKKKIIKSSKIIEKAVAIRYDQRKDTAPRVTAKGEGSIAEHIKKIAQQMGIPLYRDEDLVEILGLVEIDREIPIELYTAIAQILAWIYNANLELKK